MSKMDMRIPSSIKTTHVVLQGQYISAASAKPQRPLLYDEVRADLMYLSSIQPIDSMAIRQILGGYAGILESQGSLWLFTAGSEGFVTEAATSDYKTRVVYQQMMDDELAASHSLRRLHAQHEQAVINESMQTPPVEKAIKPPEAVKHYIHQQEAAKKEYAPASGRKKPYGHVAYWRHSHGHLTFVKQKGSQSLGAGNVTLEHDPLNQPIHFDTDHEWEFDDEIVQEAYDHIEATILAGDASVSTIDELHEVIATWANETYDDAENFVSDILNFFVENEVAEIEEHHSELDEGKRQVAADPEWALVDVVEDLLEDVPAKFTLDPPKTEKPKPKAKVEAEKSTLKEKLAALFEPVPKAKLLPVEKTAWSNLPAQKGEGFEHLKQVTHVQSLIPGTEHTTSSTAKFTWVFKANLYKKGSIESEVVRAWNDTAVTIADYWQLGSGLTIQQLRAAFSNSLAQAYFKTAPEALTKAERNRIYLGAGQIIEKHVKAGALHAYNGEHHKADVEAVPPEKSSSTTALRKQRNQVLAAVPLDIWHERVKKAAAALVGTSTQLSPQNERDFFESIHPAGSEAGSDLFSEWDNHVLQDWVGWPDRSSCIGLQMSWKNLGLVKSINSWWETTDSRGGYFKNKPQVVQDGGVPGYPPAVVMRSVLARYELCQAVLRNRYPLGYVRLRRGIGGQQAALTSRLKGQPYKVAGTEYPAIPAGTNTLFKLGTNPGSSWTDAYKAPLGGDMAIEKTIPIANIYSSHYDSDAYNDSEKEFIVINRVGHVALTKKDIGWKVQPGTTATNTLTAAEEQKAQYGYYFRYRHDVTKATDDHVYDMSDLNIDANGWDVAWKPWVKKTPPTLVLKGIKKPWQKRDKWRSAGGVLIKDGKVALVAPKGKFGGYEWTFPKGKLDEGETDEQAAEREVREEAGLQGEIVSSLGEHEGDYSVTHYFLMNHAGDATESLDDEMAETRFVDFATAKKLLNRSRDKKVLAVAEEVLSKTRKKPYGHVAYTKRSPKGKLILVKQKGVKPDTNLAKKTTQTFTKHDRPAGGSQGGSWYTDEHGDFWFGKPGKADRLGTEHVANQIYRLFNTSAPETKIAMVDGQARLMSKELKGIESDPATIRSTDVHRGFVVDAWLANWDVVGLTHDNILVEGKAAHRIDNGGAMIFRAMGAPKQFSPPVVELESMRDPKFTSGSVFHKISDKMLDVMIYEFEEQWNTHKKQVKKFLETSGMSVAARDACWKGLKARAAWIIKDGPTKHVIKADQLPGGRADKKQPKDFDKVQLTAGTKHEREHTTNQKLAQEIAMDHLAEDAQYYIKLKRVEKAKKPYGHTAYIRTSKKTGKTTAVAARGVKSTKKKLMLSALPRDMREELFNLHATSVNPKAKEKVFNSKRVPLLVVDISGIDVSGYDADSATSYDLDKTPPIAIADGKLIDGGHRVLAAQHQGLTTLPAIDLTGLLDPESTGFISTLKKETKKSFVVRVRKALPKGGGEEPEEKVKKTKPGKASSKVAGSGGKTRYDYPGEEGGDAPPPKPSDAQQDPVPVPEDKTFSADPKELAQQVGVPLPTLTRIAGRFSQQKKLGGRAGFVSFMQSQLKPFVKKHKLDGDYFGLVYDALTKDDSSEA